MKNRNSGIDLVKVIASLFVVLLHSLIISDFYTKEIGGPVYYLALILKITLYTCVPLFLISTGYLMSKVKLTINYFKKIIKVLIIYFIITIIAILVIKLYINPASSLKELIIGIFSFKTHGYSWYIEMYIGLFLLIPFINLIYNNLKDKQEKIILLIIMLLLTGIPTAVNMINIEGIQLILLPDWWINLFPLTYYFIGCYIEEYNININKKILLSILSLLIMFVAAYYYHYTKFTGFGNNIVFSNSSLSVIVISTIVFLILYDYKFNSNKINIVLAKISNVTLSIYLFSYIFDIIVQHLNIPILYAHKYSIFITMFTVSPLIYIFSTICALILNFILGLSKQKEKINISIRNHTKIS